MRILTETKHSGGPFQVIHALKVWMELCGVYMMVMSWLLLTSLCECMYKCLNRDPACSRTGYSPVHSHSALYSCIQGSCSMCQQVSTIYCMLPTGVKHWSVLLNASTTLPWRTLRILSTDSDLSIVTCPLVGARSGHREVRVRACVGDS